MIVSTTSSVEPRHVRPFAGEETETGEEREEKVRVAGITPLPGLHRPMQTASLDVSLCNRFVDESIFHL
jgi:hypothetical protein